jgi:hypothetical protein
MIWALTIGPHEIGHFICAPFGQLLAIAGGSIWQVLFWALLGMYAFFIRRQIRLAFLFWVVTGHSFINMSVYIADARARQMPLLFGMDASHHDWWNLLNQLGLLVWMVVGVGLFTTWLIPVRWGRAPRFEGNPLRLMAAAWRLFWNDSDS